MAMVDVILSALGAGLFGLTGAYLLYRARELSRLTDGSRSGRGKDPYSEFHHQHHGTSKRSRPDEAEEHKKRQVIRMFHRSALASWLSIAMLGFITFYATLWTGELYLTRADDSATINPWRFLLLYPLASGVMGALASLVLGQFWMDVALATALSGVARFFFGLAVLRAPPSAAFWALFGLGVLFSLLHILMLFLGGGKKKRRLEMILAALFFHAVYTAIFLLSDEALGIMGASVSKIIYLVADVAFYLVPALFVLRRGFYRRYDTLMLPRMLYHVYGLDGWWLNENLGQLHGMWGLEVLVSRTVMPHADPQGCYKMRSTCAACGWSECKKITDAPTDRAPDLSDSNSS